MTAMPTIFSTDGVVDGVVDGADGIVFEIICSPSVWRIKSNCFCAYLRP